MAQLPPLLILAPHVTWPARNGADLIIDALAESLSEAVVHVDVLGTNEVVRYETRRIVERRSFANRPRSRRIAAVLTLLERSHYFEARFNTPAFTREARQLLTFPSYRTVLHSYLTTAALALPDPRRRRHLVLTHNDEFLWFADQAKNAGVLGGWVSSLSAQWLRRFAQRHTESLTLLHVTSEDAAGWRRELPGHRSRVVPIGARLPTTVTAPLEANAPLRLLFVGALNVRMNLDALEHFRARYLPALRDYFGADLHVAVAGSSPLPDVQSLCEAQGWALHPDLSDEALATLIAGTTFTILPFKYSTGAKLKLLTSLASGVPVLATTMLQGQTDLVVSPSLLSDDPGQWVLHAARVRASGIDARTRARLRDIAEAHSWDASARCILDLLEAP